MKNLLSLIAVLAVFSMAANAQESSVATKSKPVVTSEVAVQKAAWKEKYKNATPEEKAKMKAEKKAKKAKNKKGKMTGKKAKESKESKKAKMEARRKIMKNLTPAQKAALKQERARHRQEIQKIIGFSDHKEKTTIAKASK